MSAMRRVLAFIALLPAAGCVPPSLEEQAADALGPEVSEPGPRHRAGQPCLVCHSAAYPIGETLFAIAGTVYERVTDERGKDGIEVELRDAAGDTWTALSNGAGNFMFIVEPALDGQVDDGDGVTRIPRLPRYPVRVAISEGARTKVMRNVIQREGACAKCHADPAGPASAGKIFLVDL